MAVRRYAYESCTVGVLRTEEGLLFFKNRDLPRDYLTRKIIVTENSPEVYALRGVNLKTGGLEGVSIGVNRHRVCVANTHVVTTADPPYDLLCEALLRSVRKQTDVPRVARVFLEERPVQGGRILVASPGWTSLVEVLGRKCRMRSIAGDYVMTNAFSLFSHAKLGLSPEGEGSRTRRETAQKLIREVTEIGRLKSLLRSHVPGKGPVSICNHADGGGTESSHIIRIRHGCVEASMVVGPPCEGDYETKDLFG